MVVVAGGGFDGSTGVTTEQVQILDVSLGTWTVGPDLPYALQWGKVLPKSDTFLIVGGYEYAGLSNATVSTVLEFGPQDMDWTEVPGLVMEHTRGRHMQIDVPVEMFCQQ